MIIRQSIDSDFNDINKILEECFDNAKKVDNYKDDDHIELVCFYDNKVVGYLVITKVLDILDKKIFLLVDKVCVLEQYRRLKIASRLMDEVEKIALSLNAKYIQLTSNNKRVGAIQLYKNKKYEIVDTNLFRRYL